MLEPPHVTLPCVVDEADVGGDVGVHCENLVTEEEEDSDVELLRWPRSAQSRTLQAEAEPDSADEWLQELLQAARDDTACLKHGSSSGAAVVVASHQQHDFGGLSPAQPAVCLWQSSSIGFAASAACPQQRSRSGIASDRSSRERTCPPLLNQARRRGAIRCLGDPDEMIASNAEKIHGLSMHEEFDISSVRVLIRPEVTPCSPRGLQALSQSLLQHVEGILARRGICIFKIGLTHDPFWRMHNNGYGYAVRGELYSCMHILLASFPEICGHIEEALITAKRDQLGCRNINPGKESMPPSGLCYVYVVTEPCGDGKGLRVR